MSTQNSLDANASSSLENESSEARILALLSRFPGRRVIVETIFVILLNTYGIGIPAIYVFSGPKNLIDHKNAQYEHMLMIYPLFHLRKEVAGLCLQKILNANSLRIQIQLE
ncbi:hypothetical protein CEXT_33751 [Caerostris extrusa]|uniref:Uncharacterized protein n=1 Tax=Caerostris extrusa TaxID=172846 RepID=A0AAV4UCH4_CAEEX|nr:hypothetical protein CEXT_33751 [Caerostris extrusa]